MESTESPAAPASLRGDARRGVTPWLPLGTAAILAAPLFVARGLPMNDLPMHEGMVALLARFGDERFTRGLYVHNWGHTDQLFYVLALPLAFALGSAVACRIVVAATLLATFVGAARLCDYLGTSRWASLVIAPVVMGWAFFQGFVAYSLGVAVFLLALPAIDRFARAPTPRGALAMSGIVLLSHAAHESSLVLACAAIAVLSLGRWDGARAWMLRAAPVAWAGALVFVEMRLERPLLTAFSRAWAEAGVQTHPVPLKIAHLPEFLVGNQGAVEKGLVLALVVGAVAVVALMGRKEDGAAQGTEAGGPLVRRRFELLAAALFVGFLVAPFSINFGAYLYVRFLSPAFIVGALALARGRDPTLPAKALCAAVPISWMAVFLPELARADAEARAVDVLLPQIEEGSAVLVTGNASDDVPSDLRTPGARVLAERGGRVVHSLAEYPVAPLQLRPEVRWDEEEMRLYLSPMELRPAWDLTRFRYVLLRVDGEAEAKVAERALAPDARLVAGEGAWWLFESTRGRVAVDAPGAEVPKPEAETIVERMRGVAGRRGGP